MELYVMKLIPKMNGMGWTGKMIPTSETKNVKSIIQFFAQHNIIKPADVEGDWEMESESQGIWVGKDGVALFILTET